MMPLRSSGVQRKVIPSLSSTGWLGFDCFELEQGKKIHKIGEGGGEEVVRLSVQDPAHMTWFM